MTAQLLDPLKLEYINGKTWRLIHKVRYVTALWRPALIVIPKGFVTDFASIPRVLWNLLPPTSACGQGSVIHDWLYTTQPCDRKTADRILREAMDVCKVGRVNRWVIYSAVRIGGGGIWKRHTEERDEAQRRRDAFGSDECA